MVWGWEESDIYFEGELWLLYSCYFLLHKTSAPSSYVSWPILLQVFLFLILIVSFLFLNLICFHYEFRVILPKGPMKLFHKLFCANHCEISGYPLGFNTQGLSHCHEKLEGKLLSSFGAGEEGILLTTFWRKGSRPRYFWYFTFVIYGLPPSGSGRSSCKGKIGNHFKKIGNPWSLLSLVKLLMKKLAWISISYMCI